MKKKLISMITVVGCLLSALSVQAKGLHSLEWNEATGAVSVTADIAGTYDVVFTNNEGNTAINELTFNEAGTQELSLPTSFPASKVFMWNSIEKMKPLTDAMDVTDCYGTAIVDSVGSEKVYFLFNTEELDYRWLIDENADIKIVKDGKEIEYTELEENDVLTIVYDVEEGFADSSFYNVYVSSDTVSGAVTEINTNEDKNSVRINDIDYRCNSKLYDVGSCFELMNTYKLFLDIFGNVAYFEEIEPPKNYGIVVGMHTQLDDEYATIELITADGYIEEYECKNSTTEGEFYSLITDEYNEYQGETITAADIINGVGIQNTVCDYTISDGRIQLNDTYSYKGGFGLEYNAVSSKLDSYDVDDSITRYISVKDYLADGSTPKSFTSANFADEGIYTSYLYDKNSEGIYRLVVVTDGELIQPPQPVNKTGIGIVSGLKKIADNDYATVSIITSEGVTEQYECADSTEQSEFYSLISDDEYAGQTVSKERIIDLGFNNFFCKFTVENDKISFDERLDVITGEFEYSEQSMSIGNVAINESTVMLDADPYIYNDADDLYILQPNSLDDGGNYYIYSCENIIVFATPQKTLRANSRLAVVKACISEETEIDGVSCYEYVVAQNGEEDTVVYIEKADNTAFSKGDVIVYEKGLMSDLVSSENAVCIMNAVSDYDKLLEDTLSLNNFSEMINQGCIDTETNKVLYGTDASTSNNVKLYFGIIYAKTSGFLTLITNKDADGTTNLDKVNHIIDFTVYDDLNTYICDYTRNNSSIYVGRVPNMSKMLWQFVLGGYEDEIIIWSSEDDSVQTVETEGIKPYLALIKTVHDDMTDIVLFQVEE